jgi:DegV family protein with EDD domain
MRTAIVTDSTSDLSEELAQMNNIFVLPTILVIGQKSVEDDRNFSRQDFYEQLPKMEKLPTTAAPGVGSFEQLYDKLFSDGYERVISIHLASALSGVYNSAHTAAYSFAERVIVVDSEQLSMGLGFQVLAAAQGVKQNLSLQNILQAIESTRKNTRLYAMLDTLEYIRRSGRVSWAKAALGNLLRIKPFIEVKDGRVIRVGETRTRKKGVERLTELFYGLGQIEKLAILHSNAEQDAKDFLSSLHVPESLTTTIHNITPVIGTHVGPNGLGFVAILKS